MVALEDPVDHRPSSLHSVLAGEECSIADHGVAQKSLVRRLFSGPFINQVELSLLASKLLARALDTSGERDAATWGTAESEDNCPSRPRALSRRTAAAAAAGAGRSPPLPFQADTCRSAGTMALLPSQCSGQHLRIHPA